MNWALKSTSKMSIDRNQWSVMTLNELHKAKISQRMMRMDTRLIKMILQHSFQNEDVVSKKHFDSSEDILPKQMEIEYRHFQISNYNKREELHHQE